MQINIRTSILFFFYYHLGKSTPLSNQWYRDYPLINLSNGGDLFFDKKLSVRNTVKIIKLLKFDPGGNMHHSGFTFLTTMRRGKCTEKKVFKKQNKSWDELLITVVAL